MSTIKLYIKQNLALISILLFLTVFGTIQFINPSFLYNNDGSLRQFGVGYKNKTILPVWLLSIVLGILSYCAVKFYATYG